MNILCLAFIASSMSPTSSAPPPHIQSLIESRIQKQWSNHRAEVAISLEDSTCPNKGELMYSGNSVILQGDNSIWRGRLQIAIDDLLSGKKIDFSSVSEAREYKAPKTASKSNFKKWLPWGIALLGIGTSAWLIHDRNQHVKQLQGLKVSF